MDAVRPGSVRAVFAVGDDEVDVPFLPQTRHQGGHRPSPGFADDVANEQDPHLAYSTARVSRTTVTLIWPGYCNSCSIFLLMFRAI